MKYIVAVILLTVGLELSAQYWFGPRVGFNRKQFIYQEESYTQDSFEVAPTYNFEVGGMAIYQATEQFSVVTEIYYEREKRTLTSRAALDDSIVSKSLNHFIAVPLLFRMSFGQEPIHYYVFGGPKLRWWMTGKGSIYLTEFDEFGIPPATYDRLAFNDKRSDPDNGVYAVPDANRLQFALVAGGGAYFDLTTGGRLLVDFRYTFGHSNMGFNRNPDFNQFNNYSENFRYRSNTMTLSVSYLFEYDVKLANKGMSTIKDSNRRRKK